MPGFLIFVPGKLQGDREARLREVGLECFTAAAGRNLPTVDVQEILPPQMGPGDAPTGLLLRLCHGPGNHPLDPPLAYQPELQEWTACRPDPERGLAAGRYWLGRIRGSVCEPAYLARPVLFDGPLAELGDGQHWQMPIARWLPKKLDLDEAGNWCGSVKAEHRWYWDTSEKLFMCWLEDQGFVWGDAIAYVVHGLSLNYCLNREIAAWLGLLDENAGAANDRPLVRR